MVSPHSSARFGRCLETGQSLSQIRTVIRPFQGFTPNRKATRLRHYNLNRQHLLRHWFGMERRPQSSVIFLVLPKLRSGHDLQLDRPD